MNRVGSLGRLWSQAFAKYGGVKLLNSSGTLFYVAKRRELRDHQFTNGQGLGFGICAPKVMFSTTPLIKLTKGYLDSPPVTTKTQKRGKSDEKKPKETAPEDEKLERDQEPDPVIRTEVPTPDALSVSDKYHENIGEYVQRATDLHNEDSKLFSECQAQLSLFQQKLKETQQLISETSSTIKAFSRFSKRTPEEAHKEITTIKKELEDPKTDPNKKLWLLDQITLLESVSECEDLKERLKVFRAQENDLSVEISALDQKIKDMDLRPTSYTDHRKIWDFLTRKLIKSGILRTKRLTTYPRRIANNFLGETIERNEQIYKALKYLAFPGSESSADRLGIMIMLGSAGSGKTHMIDQIPRHASLVLDWKEEMLTDEKITLVKELEALGKLPNSADKEKRVTEIMERQRKISFELSDILKIRRYLSTIFVFVPLSFNSHVKVLPVEEEADVAQLVVARILFCYFCVGCDFESFYKLFSDLVRNISITSAFDVIRHDQSFKHDDDIDGVPKLFETLRCFLMVDEVGKIGGKNLQTRKEELYSLLCNKVLHFKTTNESNKEDPLIADKVAIAKKQAEEGIKTPSGTSIYPSENVDDEISRGFQRFPFACLFTSLDYSTVRRFEPATFSSKSGRPLTWLQLTPGSSNFAVSSLQKRLEVEGIPDPSFMAKYLVTITSGHWRTIERIFHLIQQRRSDFFADAKQCFNSLKTTISIYEAGAATVLPTFPELPERTLPSVAPFDATQIDHIFYMIVRHNILNVPFLAITDEGYSIIDGLILSDFLVNGTRCIDFNEVPVFSVLFVSQYVKSRVDKKLAPNQLCNPFLSHLDKILQRASLTSSEDHGTAFEKFQAEYEWFRLMMAQHQTLHSFLLASQKNNSPSAIPPETTTLPEFLTSSFKNAEQKFKTFTPRSYFNPTKVYGKGKENADLMLKTIADRFLEEHPSWLNSNALNAGDVFRPTTPNNPGFDFMMKVKVPYDSSGEDYLILVECKHSDAQGTNKFNLKTLEGKYRTLMKHYNHQGGVFVLGSLASPWKKVIYVVLSAHSGIAIPKNESTLTFHDFEGAILVVTRDQLSERLGSPLNSCGALLQDVRIGEHAAAFDSSSSSSSLLSSSSSPSSSPSLKRRGRPAVKKTKKDDGSSSSSGLPFA